MGRPKGVRFGKLERDSVLVDCIVGQYESGISLHRLACAHKVGWDALRAKLVERGVRIRTMQEHYLHVYKEKPAASGGLSDAEVARLRAAIGFDPSVSYDDEESEEFVA